MFIGNKKCRIYAACGVSQTPIIYEINEVGSYIWNHIDKNNSIHSIAESIRTNMNIQDISLNDIKKDISEYINVLVEEGFLEVLDENC